MNKKLKKLVKKLNKFYWKQGQRFYLTPDCYFNKKNDFHAIIYATAKEKDTWKNRIYLFEIMTLDCFDDTILRPHEYNFREPEFVNTSHIVEAAHRPLYLDRCFTLKKFGLITAEDIEGCAKYFMHKVLGEWLPCNYEVIIEYEEGVEDIKKEIKTVKKFLKKHKGD